MSKRDSLGLSKGSQNGSKLSDERSEHKLSGRDKSTHKPTDDGGGGDDGVKKQKLAFGIKPKPKPTANMPQPKKGIQIRIGPQKSQPTNVVKAPSQAVAAVFNDDDDDEPEEMPPEARMRMRNIGRETPTSAGPNSFGKTKQGFCDAKKIFEKTMKKAMDGSVVAPSNNAAGN